MRSPISLTVRPVLSALLLLSSPGSTLTIPEIQGPGFNSAYVNTAVANVTGIVTAIGPAGFWLRNPTPDKDICTSESIYVYTGTSATTPGLETSCLVSLGT